MPGIVFGSATEGGARVQGFARLAEIRALQRV
jgi:hypothetical protein